MIRQPPPLPQQNRPLPCRTRQRPQRERVGVGVRHVCSVNLSPIHAPICPLPLWGRVGVGFACIPAGQCSPPKTLPICRQTPTRVISTTSTPESVNPTPALPRRGREPISGKTGDRSRIPPLGGRFYGSGKMANATPSPALSRTTRELFQSRCGLRPAREGGRTAGLWPSGDGIMFCFCRAAGRLLPPPQPSPTGRGECPPHRVFCCHCQKEIS